MKIFLLGIMLTTHSFAWTLNNNFGASFKNNHVKVYVDSNTVCPTSMLTPDELESMIRPAVDNFWNKVPTSNLKLEPAGFTDAPVPNLNSGRLCSPTDDACITAAGATVIPAVEEIIIGCNTEGDNFGNSNNVIAVTIPNKFSGKKILGAVIILNDNSTNFKNLSRSDKIAVLAHEIGHAIGLGHSEDTSALMYYRTVNLRKRLGQDDVDGVSFLYPMRGDLFGLSENGILGSCGTIDTGRNGGGDPPFSVMIISLVAMVILFEARRLFHRPKARPTP